MWRRWLSRAPSERPLAADESAVESVVEDDDSTTWPPIDPDTALALHLPEALYWDTIRPLIPLNFPHPVVSRRCSTAHPSASLARRPFVRMSVENCLEAEVRIEYDPERIRDLEGTGLSSDVAFDRPYWRVPNLFLCPITDRLSFEAGYPRWRYTGDRERARDLYSEVRSTWDEHMGTIGPASVRLVESLEVLHDADASEVGGSDGVDNFPILFPRDGSVRSVVEYHVRTDGRALLGLPGGSLLYRGCFPRSALGYFVRGWCERAAMGDPAALGIAMTNAASVPGGGPPPPPLPCFHERAVESLLEFGAPATDFALPILDMRERQEILIGGGQRQWRRRGFAAGYFYVGCEFFNEAEGFGCREEDSGPVPLMEFMRRGAEREVVFGDDPNGGVEVSDFLRRLYNKIAEHIKRDVLDEQSLPMHLGVDTEQNSPHVLP